MKAKPGRSAIGPPSIAGSISRGDGALPLPKSSNGANPRPEGARTRRMLAQDIDSLAIEECFVPKEVA